MFFCHLLLLFAFMSSAVTLYAADKEDSIMSSTEGRGKMKTNQLITIPRLKVNENHANEESRASPAVSYHEFLINEASYKFWAIFQLVTVAVLLYSTFAAIYYARYNYLQNLESGNYDDLLFARSFSTFQDRFARLDSQTFQRIVDAIFSFDEHEFAEQLRD